MYYSCIEHQDLPRKIPRKIPDIIVYKFICGTTKHYFKKCVKVCIYLCIHNLQYIKVGCFSVHTSAVTLYSIMSRIPMANTQINDTIETVFYLQVMINDTS